VKLYNSECPFKRKQRFATQTILAGGTGTSGWNWMGRLAGICDEFCEEGRRREVAREISKKKAGA